MFDKLSTNVSLVVYLSIGLSNLAMLCFWYWYASSAWPWVVVSGLDGVLVGAYLLLAAQKFLSWQNLRETEELTRIIRSMKSNGDI